MSYSRALHFTRATANTLCALILFRDYVAEVAQCEGESMMPTLAASGESILVEKLSIAMRSIKRGDIVIVTSPENPDKLLCKRIIGLENDSVVSSDGFLFSKIKVPKGHVWIEGDNAARSHDSRAFGPVPFGLVRGKAICKMWPWSALGERL